MWWVGIGWVFPSKVEIVGLVKALGVGFWNRVVWREV